MALREFQTSKFPAFAEFYRLRRDQKSADHERTLSSVGTDTDTECQGDCAMVYREVLLCGAKPDKRRNRIVAALSDLFHPLQKLVVKRRAKLRDGPMALPEKRPPKSITSMTFVRFSPSAWKRTFKRSDL